MRHIFGFAAASLAGIQGAFAHGYLASFISNGVTYPGWAPFTDPYQTPVPVRVARKVTDNGPVENVASPDITCNRGGNIPTNLFADVTAGSQVKFQWDQWGSSHSGPVMTYMAKCNGGCANFKGDSGSPWFKIDHWGWDKTATPPWGSDRLAKQGASWTVTIPKSISNGEYLLMHEILGLHVAGNVGMAQFYPHCVQVKVTGGGSANPSGVTLPGAYKATEPGIWTQLWWYSASNASASYPIPGGPVWTG
ncbi:endoglucanase-4 [Crassisporium funariophilum]|nr:endoglucanase-4 [Crassisporium funariophilum]